MNIATLDKATEKMIDKMTPEELASYANELAQLQAKNLANGSITVDGADHEIELFMKTRINKLHANEYIKYLNSLHLETQKDLFVLLTESHLKNFDLRMSLVELEIAVIVNTGPVYSLLLRQQHPAEEAEQMIGEARKESRERVAKRLKLLEDIKKEQVEYLSHPMWEKYGITPKVEERESLLSDDVRLMYMP